MGADRSVWTSSSLTRVSVVSRTSALVRILEEEPFHRRMRAKVQEQSYLQNCGTQIMQDLGLMPGLKPGAGLRFHQHRTPHHEICSELTHDMVSETNREGQFALDPKSCVLQRQDQCFHIDAFQETRSQLIVYIKKDSDDLFREILMFHAVPILVYPCYADTCLNLGTLTGPVCIR